MTTATQTYEQERDDYGRFGSGGGGTGSGLPRHDTHAATEGGGKFQNGTQKEAQVTWAHTKAKEQGRPTFMAPNPAHDPAKVGSGGPFKLSYKPPTKGEYHEVKPDGSMVYHAAAPKAPKGAPKGVAIHARDTADADFARAYLAAPPPRTVGFVHLRRHVDAFAAGDVTTAFRILAAGVNETDKGPLVFTPNSAKMVEEAYLARGNPFVGYYEHEDQLPLEKRGGAPMRGECSAPSADLAVRGPAEAPECWAQNVAWTDEAKRQIQTGKRRQISPVAKFYEDTREVIEIVNFSLCSEGATHFGTLLASRSGKDTSKMDEMIQQLLDACNAGEWEEAENIVQQMEAGDGEGYGKLARGLMAKMAKAPPPPPPAAAADPGAATSRLAAARAQMVANGASTVALDRAAAEFTGAAREARDAAKESRRETVSLKLSRAREEGLLGPEGNPVVEREHLAGADPKATESFLSHLRTLSKVGILTLTKPGTVVTTPEAREGQRNPPGAAVENFGLSEVEIATAKQNGVSLEAFSKSKTRVNVRTTVEPGKA